MPKPEDDVHGQEDQMKLLYQLLMTLQEELRRWTLVANGLCDRTKQPTELCHGERCCRNLTEQDRQNRRLQASQKCTETQAKIDGIRTGKPLAQAA